MAEQVEVKRHSLVVYAAIAVGFSWLLFWPNVRAEEALGSIPLLLTRIVASFGPGLAAVAVLGKQGGWSSVKDLLSQAVQLPQRKLWLWLAVLVPALTTGVAIGILVFRENFSLGLITWRSWVMLIPNFFLSLILFGAFAGEIGWRGFLLPRLEKHYSALVSSIIIGFLWGLWQLPTYYFRGVVEYNLSPTWLFLETIALSIILTWLYKSSKSLAVAIIFSGLYHTLIQFFLPVTQVYQLMPAFQQNYTAVLVNLALIILLFCGGTTLVFHYQPRRSSN